MENNAPIHTSGNSQKWKRAHSIKTMAWPAQSPDLNPVENVWHKLKVAVEEREARSLKRDDFVTVVVEEWENLVKYTEFLESLV